MFEGNIHCSQFFFTLRECYVSLKFFIKAQKSAVLSCLYPRHLNDRLDVFDGERHYDVHRCDALKSRGKIKYIINVAELNDKEVIGK